MGFCRWWAIAAVAVASAMALPSSAQKLYAASVRTLTEGSDAIGGSLYSVDAKTGAATLIGPIQLNGQSPLGVTGLSVHPTTGVMYGITSSLSRTNPKSLVIIDPATGNARMVGPLKLGGSDISFNKNGILFTFLPETHQLGVINLDTGLVTAIGNPGRAGPPAGLAVDEKGVAYITAKGATGTVDTVDISTGQITVGPRLKGAPFESTINSMAFTPEGTLLAVNSNQGSPASTSLITIDLATGAVTSIGSLPDDTDALAFAVNVRGEDKKTDWRMVALITLGVLGVLIAAVGFLTGRKT